VTGANPLQVHIVVIGGLITSTLLSLLVVPVVFTFVDDVERRIRRLSPDCPLVNLLDAQLMTALVAMRPRVAG
jgi:hypothetical protein